VDSRFEFSEDQPWMRPAFAAKSLRVRLTNDENVVTFRYSKDDGRSWTLHPLRLREFRCRALDTA
jgi:xylan 1,4-beta-xylosidase